MIPQTKMTSERNVLKTQRGLRCFLESTFPEGSTSTDSVLGTSSFFISVVGFLSVIGIGSPLIEQFPLRGVLKVEGNRLP